MKRILVVGAGFTGSVIARELAEAGYIVDVFEERDHVGGNCHTNRDSETGIMIHVHGPHIFHTDNEDVWNYVNRFSHILPYICQVKATTSVGVFSLPINLLTINQFFSKKLSPKEAEKYISNKTERIPDITSFEDQALSFIGRELYETFFKGYPIKQWGVHPRDLPSSILKRLPVRFNYNDNYFEHKHQGIPENGYTDLIEKILQHKNISLHLRRLFMRNDCNSYDHTFYSGTIDGWFNYQLGYLGYRTLRFDVSRHIGDFQGCAVMSYPDVEVPFTRITEHKHFSPWERFDKTIIFHEYSAQQKPGDIPYYPIRLVNDKSTLMEYVNLAEKEHCVTFMGRLGTYRYLDMDITIAEALNAAKLFIEFDKENQKIPVFFNHPL